MKKTLKIEVDCANCANLMEDAVKRVQGIKNVVVNFMTQKMIIDFEENVNCDDVTNNVITACKKVEPDCEIFL